MRGTTAGVRRDGTDGSGASAVATFAGLSRGSRSPRRASTDLGPSRPCGAVTNRPLDRRKWWWDGWHQVHRHWKEESVDQRLGRYLSLIGTLLVLAVPGAASAATITVGQKVSANEICGTDGIFFQTAVSSGASYTVPDGNWTITSWSADGNIWGGQSSLIVLRPSASTPGAFDVVGESALESLATSQLNTFSTHIAVRGGDIIGIWGTATTACAAGIPSAADTFSFKFVSPEPSVGTTLAGFGNAAFSRINVSATLVSQPEVPTSVSDCKHGGWQAFPGFRNQGDCVSFVSTRGKNSPSSPAQ